VFVAHALPNLSSFTTISDIFHTTYPSPAAAFEVLSAYFPNSETTAPDELLRSLSCFVSDAMFGLPASRAAKFLRLEGGDRRTTVKEYSTQFGNPFPGPSFGVAHHCVDLIYAFDAFHDFLADADKKEAAGENGAYKAKKTNVDLTLQLQKDWIEFITKDSRGEENGKQSETIKVYGHDRAVREESSDAKQWVEQRKRFEVLAKEPACANVALGKMIMGG
jgi:carboxylesterase type B